MALHIRPFVETDSIEDLTDLIHSAYAELGAMGLQYWGTHQKPKDTLERISKGIGLVAEIDGAIVGTLALHPPEADSEVAVYRDQHTNKLTQFAVDPAKRGVGIGRALHSHAVEIARGKGATRVALDTAEGATHLIAMYSAWGYQHVGYCDYRPFTNYRSVVMVLTLGAAQS